MRRIIVDSGSSIKPNEAQEMGIDIIPLRIQLGGKEYIDGFDIDSSLLYKLIKETGEFPKTSLPHLDKVEELFNSYLEKGDEILYLSLSSKLSSTYSTIAAMYVDNPKVRVFDTLSAVGGVRMLAIEALSKPELSLDDLVEELTQSRGKIRICAIPETLDYLLKGGRLKKSAWMLGTLLMIKPALGFVDGGIVTLAKLHGIKKGIAYVAEHPIEDHIDTSKPIIASYTESRINLDKVVELLKKKGIEPTGYDDLTPTIAAHWGPNAFGLIYMVK